MKRFFILSLLGLTFTALLALSGIGLVLYSFDFNNYKEEIASKAQELIGRPVAIEGQISHSFFPTALQVQRLIVRDDPRFSDGDIFSLETVDLHLNLLALVSKTVDIQKIHAQGVTANLIVAGDGSKNWEPPKTKKIADSTSLEAPSTVPSSQTKKDAIAWKIEDLSVNNIALTYVNKQDKTSYKANLDSLHVANLLERKDFPLSLTGSIQSIHDGMTGDFSIHGSVSIKDMDEITASFSKIYTHFALPKLHMEGNISAKGSARIAKLDTFFVTFEKLDGAVTNDKGVKESLALTTNIVFSNRLKELEINDLDATVAGTKMSGTLALTLPGGVNLAKGTLLDVRGDLAIPVLDINTLQAAVATFSNSTPSTGTPSDTTAKANTASKKATTPSLAFMKQYSGQLSLHIDKLLFDKFEATQIIANPSLQNGKLQSSLRMNKLVFDKLEATEITANPILEGTRLQSIFSLKTCDGSINGTAKIDFAQKNPIWQYNGKIENITVEKLAQALNKPVPLTGTFTANANINGQGFDWAHIAPSLTGKLSFILSKSVMKDVFSEKISALLKINKSIDISNASASFALVNGLATTNDIDVSTSLGTAQGKGTINLGQDTLDLLIEVRPTGAPVVPLVIDGKLSKPTIDLHARGFITQTLPEAAKALPQVTEDAANLINLLPINSKTSTKLDREISKVGQDAAKIIEALPLNKNRENVDVEETVKALEGLFSKKKKK